jgi:hypothetical protein
MSLTGDFCFDLRQGIGTILSGDSLEFLAVAVAAVDFVKAGRWIAGPSYDRGSGERIVHKRSGLSGVKQTSARFGFQAYNHSSLCIVGGISANGLKASFSHSIRILGRRVKLYRTVKELSTQ